MQISEAIWTQILQYITVMNKTVIISFHMFKKESLLSKCYQNWYGEAVYHYKCIHATYW